MRCKEIINLDNLEYNIKKIQKLIPTDKIVAVVKADAYGHGYEKVVKLCFELGIKWFAVATYNEAIEVYNLMLNVNILILGPVEMECYKDLEKKGIHFAVTSFNELEYISKNTPTALYHLAYDTGMGRIGFDDSDIENAITNYNPIGIFTHLSVAENDDKFTKEQLKKFNNIASKYDIKYKHALNSYGSLMQNKDKYNLFRIGITFYGGDNTGDFKICKSLYARVSYVKKLKYDSFIGYGNTYRAKKDDIIATISIGYADGITRMISNKGKVYLNGKYYDIIGNICMDQMMIKADEDVLVGDFVEIYGEHNSILDLAKVCSTISYEILCNSSKRVVREYKGGRNDI